MKILISMLLVVFLIGQGFTQDIVNWSFEIVEKESKTYIEITAEISDGWNIYSQHTDPDGPIPTSFDFEPNEDYKLVGEVEEKSEMILEHSELFGVDVMKYKEQAKFLQEISLKKEKTEIKGSVRFMCCDKTKCLPPESIPFELKI